jgi:hypothetical protein
MLWSAVSSSGWIGVLSPGGSSEKRKPWLLCAMRCARHVLIVRAESSITVCWNW